MGQDKASLCQESSTTSQSSPTRLGWINVKQGPRDPTSLWMPGPPARCEAGRRTTEGVRETWQTQRPLASTWTDDRKSLVTRESPGQEFIDAMISLELRGVGGTWPVRYCADMLLSGHTFVA